MVFRIYIVQGGIDLVVVYILHIHLVCIFSDKIQLMITFVKNWVVVPSL